jgi:Rieske Fe-S protein
VIGLPACDFGSPAGRLDAGGDAPEDDLATDEDLAGAPADLARVDLAKAKPDLAGGNSCGGSGFLVTNKKPAAFAQGTATYVFIAQYQVFVCRDAKGLYALTAVCTHAGCTVNFANPSFSCPCHGSQFNFNGVVTQGPAGAPLEHYAICLDDGGDVVVDANNVVSATTRF